MQTVHTLIIGSGAAGLCAAVRLKELGVNDIIIATDGLDKGTSINTGSDKQTYYKLSLCGRQNDSIYDLAKTLFDGGSMHGDIALVEAAYSVRCFMHLVQLGVKFPTDKYGQFAGYKTDHDPRQRATSVGPYTSRDMCLALIKRVKELQIPVQEHFHCIELLKCGDRVCGAVFLDENDISVPILAENIVFAVGGPGGLYEHSVYPPQQTGSIGLALAIGAEARNLPEMQFGLASIKHRWNVSGTYMQVIPRFVSTNQDGSDEKEFLADMLACGDLYSRVFLKGYQWPFDVKKIDGSSLIDILVYTETIEKNRRVFLDYRCNPTGLDFGKLKPEAKDYLEKSGALLGTPIERLEKMNPAAIQLYAGHGIDLRNEMLEIAVCAQHNNGGLAGTIWWESTNIKHLFPIGEVNGSHGVTRPGGAALNAGQVGAFRAAEYIAHQYNGWTVDIEAVEQINERVRYGSFERQENDEFSRKAMSKYGGMIRNLDALKQFYSEHKDELSLTARVYLSAISYYEDDWFDGKCLYFWGQAGSRGSALVLCDRTGSGGCIEFPNVEELKKKMIPENEQLRDFVLLTRYNSATDRVEHCWKLVRLLPDEELWFETAWKEFRDGEIYE